MENYRDRLLPMPMEVSKTADTYRFSCASEYPVKSWDGVREILLHTPEAINLDRLNGMVMVWNHGTDVIGAEPLGRVIKWEIADRKSYCEVRWADTDTAKKYRQLVDEGIVTNVSIRYQVETSEYNDRGDCVCTRWQPVHFSLVSDPADFTVGYGRSLSDRESPTVVVKITKDDDDDYCPMEDCPLKRGASECRMSNCGKKRGSYKSTMKDKAAPSGPTVNANITPEGTMDEETKNPTVDADRAIADIREQEVTRVRSITAMGQQHGMTGLANQLIEGGKSVEESRAIFDKETSARNNQQPLSRTSPQDYLPGFGQKENSQYSLLRAYRSRIPGTAEYTGNCFEKEISNEIAQKTGKADGLNIPYRHLSLLGTRDRDVLNTGTQASGGYLVQETVLGTQFIDLLRNKSSVLSAGATFLPGLVGNYSMPGQATGTQAYWISENENVVPDSITFRNITLNQRTIAARVGITRNMIMQSSVEVENIARRDLATAIALGLDKAALFGTGDGKEPLGILNTPGIGGTSLGNDGGALTWAALVNLWKAIMVGNGDTGTMGWIMPAAVAAKLMVTPMQGSGVEGNFILKPDSDRLILFPYQVTEQMPANLTKGNGTNLGTILLGVWSEFVIGNWGTLSIDMNPYGQSWGTGGVEMLAMQSADTAVRHPESFAAYSDVITT